MLHAGEVERNVYLSNPVWSPGCAGACAGWAWALDLSASWATLKWWVKLNLLNPRGMMGWGCCCDG